MRIVVANTEMAAAWDGDDGADWARDWDRYDRSLHGYHGPLLEAAGVVPGEGVIDVGCGNGEATRDAARAAVDGPVLGVDLSSAMLERARQLAEQEGLTNVRFEQADAQVMPFTGAHDVAISRFGVMFFGDPVAAFANIGDALRPGGRLAMMVWQGIEGNEWMAAVGGALAAGRELPMPSPGTPGPFGLADADTVRAILSTAGFEGARLDSLEEPVCLGTDTDDAYAFMSATGVARGMLGGLDEQTRARALDALRATLADHAGADGVVFRSAAWLVTAHRPG